MGRANLRRCCQPNRAAVNRADLRRTRQVPQGTGGQPSPCGATRARAAVCRPGYAAHDILFSPRRDRGRPAGPVATAILARAHDAASWPGPGRLPGKAAQTQSPGGPRRDQPFQAGNSGTHFQAHQRQYFGKGDRPLWDLEVRASREMYPVPFSAFAAPVPVSRFGSHVAPPTEGTAIPVPQTRQGLPA
jgi:hypothetical protein